MLPGTYFSMNFIKSCPGGNMSYLPPWAPSSGGGHYPPHMIPPHPSSTSSSVAPHTAHSSTSSTSSPVVSVSQNPASIYQTLSPMVKSTTTTSVSVTQATHTPKPSTLPAGSASSPTSTTSSALSSTSSISLGDPYEPQGFQRSTTPPIKRPGLGEKMVDCSSMTDPPPEMLLALAGPSSMDFKAVAARNHLIPRSPGKYPAPEQLANPVMFSYQGRGRPRKNWTHAGGLPTMIPVTHPSMHSALDDDDEENKPFKCNLCGKAFKLKGGLVQHERTHSTDRPYVCPECGKLFRQPTHLQQHVRIHTGDKPYDCAFCGKSFRQRTILNQHLRIHTGEKPYVCMECGKQFRQKAILDQHFRTHLGEKPYACPHPSCRKHFREMASLISHMKCHKDVPDPRIVLQQAKRMIKEERFEVINLDGPEMDETIEGSDRGLGQDRLGQERGMGPEGLGLSRLGQDRVMGPDRSGMGPDRSGMGPDRVGMGPDRVGMGPDRVGMGPDRVGMGPDRGGMGPDRGGMGQDLLNQLRLHGGQHDHRGEGSSNSSGEHSGYQGNGEPLQHENRAFPGQHVSNNSTQKSPNPGHSLPQHSNTERPADTSSTQATSQPPQSSPLSPNMMPTPQMAMANLIPYPHSIFPAASYMMPPPDPRQYHPQSQHPRPNQ